MVVVLPRPATPVRTALTRKATTAIATWTREGAAMRRMWVLWAGPRPGAARRRFGYARSTWPLNRRRSAAGGRARARAWVRRRTTPQRPPRWPRRKETTARRLPSWLTSRPCSTSTHSDASSTHSRPSWPSSGPLQRSERKATRRWPPTLTATRKSPRVLRRRRKPGRGRRPGPRPRRRRRSGWRQRQRSGSKRGRRPRPRLRQRRKRKLRRINARRRRRRWLK
mmetsp:Transcript_30099/g.80548  ORF Transcript_30099/g.80548 Transcript_30099/m.80548 type:complete len:224 (+) Transcript_30099:322-993(+)